MKYSLPGFILGSILYLNYDRMSPFSPYVAVRKYFNKALIRIIIPENFFTVNPEINPGEINPRADILHIQFNTAPDARPSPPTIPDDGWTVVAYQKKLPIFNV